MVSVQSFLDGVDGVSYHYKLFDLGYLYWYNIFKRHIIHVLYCAVFSNFLIFLDTNERHGLEKVTEFHNINNKIQILSIAKHFNKQCQHY